MHLKILKILSRRLSKDLISSCLTLIGILSIGACGVKGDPLPPLKPVDLGRGQPSYKKATEDIPLQKYSPADDREDEEKESEDE